MAAELPGWKSGCQGLVAGRVRGVVVEGGNLKVEMKQCLGSPPLKPFFPNKVNQLGS